MIGIEIKERGTSLIPPFLLQIYETKGPLVKVKSVIFTLSVDLFLFYKLAPFKELGFILSIVSMMAIALSVLSCPFFTRLMSIIFLLLGTLMVARKEIDFSTYVLLYGDTFIRDCRGYPLYNESRVAVEEQGVRDSSPFFYRKRFQIILAIVLLLFLIVTLDFISKVDLMVSVTLLILPFAWIWCLLLRKKSRILA